MDLLCKDDHNRIKTIHPLMPAYGLTIPKSQGQNLLKCIVWLHSQLISPGGAYIALSRGRRFDNIFFMVPIMASQLTSVRLKTF